MEKGKVIRIGIVGAESTGKTWLAERLAERFSTVWVPEFAREFFSSRDVGDYTREDLVHIAREQSRREEEAGVQANGLLFCDTTPITIKIWSQLEFGDVLPELERLLGASTHDFYLIADNSVPWAGDPLRLNKFDRDLIFARNLEEVLRTGKSYSIVTGTGDSRLQSAVASLGAVIPKRRP